MNILIKIIISFDGGFIRDYYLKVKNNDDVIFDARYSSQTDLHRTANELASMFESKFNEDVDLIDLTR